MAYRLTWFLVFFCMLFAGGTFFLNHGVFHVGTLLGSLLTAGVIAAIIQAKK